MIERKVFIDSLLPIQKYGCHFRLVNFTDAEFILSLRNDPKLSRFINETSNKLEDQIHWLKEYKLREAQGIDFYIICMSNDNKIRYGLNRIYNIGKDDFEFGSWLYGPESPKDKSILGSIFTHTLAFEFLHLKTSKVMVRKDNTSVLRYYRSFNPIFVDQDELYYYFSYEYEIWKRRRIELLKLLGYSTS